MNDELDKKLCEKFPKMFVQRGWHMEKTAMCWGFAHGDGWFNLIWALCSNIQHHIDHTRNQRLRALRLNRALKTGDVNKVARVLSTVPSSEWALKSAQQKLDSGIMEKVPDACKQVVVVQVKEKFGSLRFYYDGGDAEVSAMVRVVETLSGLTCETCGKPGTTDNRRGWVYTSCDEHRPK